MSSFESKSKYEMYLYVYDSRIYNAFSVTHVERNKIFAFYRLILCILIVAEFKAGGKHNFIVKRFLINMLLSNIINQKQ